MEHTVDLDDPKRAWDDDGLLHATCSCGYYMVGLTPEQVAAEFMFHTTGFSEDPHRAREGD